MSYSIVQLDTAVRTAVAPYRAALLKAVEVIQVWHNMGMKPDEASKMWDIYWRRAPEMKPIREALAGVQHSEGKTHGT